MGKLAQREPIRDAMGHDILVSLRHAPFSAFFEVLAMSLGR